MRTRSNGPATGSTVGTPKQMEQELPMQTGLP